MLRWIWIAAATPALLAQPSGIVDAAKAREETRMVRQSLEQGHPGLYDHISKAALDSAFDRVERSFDKPTTAFEIYARLAPVVASIRCFHTSFLLPNSMWQPSHRVFPFQIAVREGRLWFLRTHSGETAVPPGSEILSINGVAAPALLAAMLPVVPVDGQSGAAAARLGQAFLFPKLLVDLCRIEAPYRISYRAPGAKTAATATAAGVARSDLRPPSPPAEALRFLDGDRVAVLRTVALWSGVAKVHNEELVVRVSRLWEKLKAKLGLPPDPPPPAFSERIGAAFDQIARKGSRALILDLRGDLGADDAGGAHLLAHLVDKPFVYYRDLLLNSIQPPFHGWANPTPALPAHWFEGTPDGKWRYTASPGWGTHRPRQPRFAGPVFAVVDGTTASGACEFLSAAVAAGRVTVVGSDTAGVYRGNSSGFSVRVPLPHSGVVLTVPMVAFRMAVDEKRDGNRPVTPAIPVEPTAGDLVRGVDPAMGRAVLAAREVETKPRGE